MRDLTLSEIKRFSSRPGVRKIAVENFLISMGFSPVLATYNMFKDARLYHWSASTQRAILDGIALASRTKFNSQWEWEF